jgi:ABC-2 type transport system ATP-binding protein
MSAGGDLYFRGRMAAVSASDLTKHFGRTRAVDSVDLAVGEGEVRGLLGPNGAGKTTLLRMLLGLVRPDAGSIELLDAVTHDDGAPALEGVSGFVEEPSFYPYLSGRANLEVLAELDSAGSRRRIDGVLEQVELRTRAGDRVSSYSSGMRQRLGIAAALMRVPRLLLLDEPTAGLDPAGVRFVCRLLGNLAEAGVAVLLSSHQIGEVEGICDSFTVLSRGRVVWEGTAAEMRAQAPASAYRLSTSDDRLAIELARDQPGVQVELSPGDALTVKAPAGAMDPFVLRLAQSGVAVRRLELTVSPLESMFFTLTEEAPEASKAIGELADNSGVEL